MQKMEECLIHIDLANALIERGDSTNLKPEGLIGLSCPECHKTVTVRAEVNGAAPHFEHLARNPECSLSDEREPISRFAAADNAGKNSLGGNLF